MKTHPQVRTGRVSEKTYSITDQPTRKRSQNRIISPLWGEAPAERIEMKICTDVDLGDVIMDVKFKFEQEAQLILTTGATRLSVSRGQQTWYHFGSLATFR